jgi:hypothetical protein
MTAFVRHGEDFLTRTAPLSFLGLHVGTRMTILRLPDRKLLVHSPIALDDELRTAVDAEGTVAHVICPNAYHHLHAKGWVEHYPDAVIHAPRGLRKKRPDLRIDRDLEDATATSFGADIVPLHIDGSMLDETVFVHRPSKTVLAADLLENFSGSDHFLTRLYLKAGGIHGKPGWNRLMRFVYRDKRAARRSVDALLEHDIDRLIISHGDVIEQDAKPIIRESLAFLG